MLGYRRVLDQIDVFPLPTDPEGIARLSGAVGRAVATRRRLHGLIKDFMTNDGGPLPTELHSAPRELRRMVEQSRRVHIVNAPGPDHIVLATSLVPRSDHAPAKALYTMMGGAAFSLLAPLFAGSEDPERSLPVRGGIDVGAGSLVQPEDFLYSPALTRAYLLESEQAVFPRVLIGERLAQYIQALINEQSPDPWTRINGNLALNMKAMLFTDFDGKLALDFFGPGLRKHIGDADALVWAQGAWAFVQDALLRIDDAHVKAKYEYLANYMKPRLSLWIPAHVNT
jgi:hypothetical protein